MQNPLKERRERTEYGSAVHNVRLYYNCEEKFVNIKIQLLGIGFWLPARIFISLNPVGNSDNRNMSIINKQIGLNIKSMRIKYGLSQIELAEKIDLSFQQVQKYEKGVTAISVSRLHQIAEAFGVPAQIFYPPPPQSDEVGEPRPVYDASRSEPVHSPVFTQEERVLLKIFRKIRNRKVKQGVIQQLKGLVELERESGN